MPVWCLQPNFACVLRFNTNKYHISFILKYQVFLRKLSNKKASLMPMKDILCYEGRQGFKRAELLVV
jgi:hypothetical protein